MGPNENLLTQFQLTTRTHDYIRILLSSPAQFVLKHEQFFHLREVDEFPNSLNPLAPDSLNVVQEMLTQVLEKHPQTQWFHIGADEV